MKNHLKKLENKKILQEYTYIKTDLILKKSILEESQSEFMKIVYDKIGNKRKKLEEDINNELKQEKEKKDFPDNLKKKAKNLYREIPKKTHPDKDTFGVYTNIFSESAIAYEDCDLLTLYSICDQLHIEYEIDEIKENPDGEPSDDAIDDAVYSYIKANIRGNALEFLTDLGFDYVNFINKKELQDDLLREGTYGDLSGYDGEYDSYTINGTNYNTIRI